MRYTAVGVGAADLSYGPDYFRVLQSRGIPVLNAGTSAKHGEKPYIIRQVAGGLKVGIVSFGASAAEDRNNPDLLAARMKAFTEARKKSNILILLDQADVATDDWILANAEKIGFADVLVGSGYRLVSMDAKRVGNTWVVPTGAKGSSADRVDIEINDRDVKVTCTRTDLDPSFPDDPSILKIVQAFKTRQAATYEQSAPSKPADPAQRH